MTKIFYKLINKKAGIVSLPQGDWFDLKIAEDVCFNKGEFKYLSLGIAMKLPEGYEALVLPRSSTFKKYGILLANSTGVIDNSFSSDKDIWHFPAYATKNVNIEAGTRICQFRIQLSQKATFWQKLKWLFGGKIVLKEVLCLDGIQRGGLGSTGN